jgi:outer membrane autotransporter protein
VIELVGWTVLGGLETNGKFFPAPVVSADGTNIVNLKLGARTSIGRHHSFYLGYGQALTHEVWYKHIVRLEYRYTF